MQIRWSVLVDTDAIYTEARQVFGPDARLDYLNLPKKIVEFFQDVSFFTEKKAIVLRHGKEWQGFIDSLEKFGYNVIPIDRGMRSHTIPVEMKGMLNRCESMIVITSGDRARDYSIIPSQDKDPPRQIRILTFEPMEFPVDGVVFNHYQINRDWLWIRDY